MLAQKKKVMMMRRPSRLPSGYRELAYIEASGEQYIDLDMSDLTRFVVDFAATPGGNETTGIIVAVSTYQGRWLGVLNENTRIGLNSSDASQCFANITVTERNTFDGIITASSGMTVQCGGETITRAGTNATRKPTLFAMYSPSADEMRGFCEGRMFPGQFWQSGTTGDPYRFTVPVERVSDGEAGIYDMIHDVFLGNAGSGTFGKGPYV